MVVVSAVLTVLTLGATGTASAKCRHTPKGNPAVKEYVEHIPTVCGPKESGTGTGSTRLPASINRALGTGREADLLRNLATKDSFGAPQTKTGKPNARLNTKLQRNAGRNPLTAGISAATGGSDGRLILLISLMAVLALGAGAVAYRRRIGR
jgi:hypothetical protein